MKAPSRQPTAEVPGRGENMVQEGLPHLVQSARLMRNEQQSKEASEEQPKMLSRPRVSRQ